MFFRRSDRSRTKLKKKLLAQAVAVNVVELSGARPRSRRRRRWVLVLTSAALAGGAVGLGWWQLGGKDTRVGEVAVVATAPALDLPLGFPLPERLDQTATLEAAPGSSGRPGSLGNRAGPPGPPLRISAGALPLGVRKVVLDPGHGGLDFGTRAGAALEKDLTLDLARRVRDRLVAGGIEVVMTRDSDVAVPLRERAAIANRAEADLFLSIHLNWLDPAVAQRGIETYRLGATDDPRVEALAAAENAESGYSFSDVRRLLDEIYLDLRQDSSARLAEAVHRELVGALRRDDPSLRDRGVKTAPFLVLVETGIPAVLAEVGCLSHDRDAERFADSTYRDRVADALSEGVRRYARHLPAPGGAP